jgi:hypothetical protein
MQVNYAQTMPLEFFLSATLFLRIDLRIQPQTHRLRYGDHV